MIQINIPDTLRDALPELSEADEKRMADAFRLGNIAGQAFAAGMAAGINKDWRPPVDTWFAPSGFSSVRKLMRRRWGPRP